MTSANITLILQRLRNGDANAWNDLAPIVYQQIKAEARRQLRNEKPDPLHQTTMLVHEAFLRLVGEPDRNWQNRGHFYRVCGQVIRRILVDSARRRKALRRGGNLESPALETIEVASVDKIDWEDLDSALTRLTARAPRQAKVVELRYFCGLSLEETAVSLDVTTKTVQRDWVAARAWLYGAMNDQRE